MGCACAWELARRGASVVLFERSVPGAEASSAAAGILGATVEARHDGPLARLAEKSLGLYPGFVRELTRRTGIDPEYRECGVLEVDFRRRLGRRRQGKASALVRSIPGVPAFGNNCGSKTPRN